jgi:methyl-accepting chemotaxis protein
VLSNFEEINVQVQKVGQMMAEIAEGSEQQTQGIGQISTAVGQLNQVTQQNAANAEESASASEELSAQAHEMQALVSRFKLSGNGGDHGTPGQGATTVRRAPAGRKLAAVGHANGKTNGTARPEDIIPFDNDDLNTLEKF